MRMEDAFNVYVTGQNYIQVKILNLGWLSINALFRSPNYSWII